ncbi:predicted protein [Uncinocarpus reesii 1704]|uniref:Uncharacterized protein n=1 Tax=Uncinocarpus reesii (strain UAMH 1704) TaxID=336963 RepID=C4JL71_UNCRE|nr:uncharacterized protein UREG_03579 [Uncinocarpus reesii 1704]EEP78733.1 predicted protein [Uncinocarpus reesii 1704]
MDWFDDTWIGHLVHFSEPQPSAWILQKKLSEHAVFPKKGYAEEYRVPAEIKAVFVCSKLGGPGPLEAVLKIWMQLSSTSVPLTKRDIFMGGDIADWERGLECDSGIGEQIALERLTQGQCTSTPHFIASKAAVQDGSMRFPGGFMYYLLMTKLPGIQVESFKSLSNRERSELRGAFQRAWL